MIELRHGIAAAMSVDDGSTPLCGWPDVAPLPLVDALEALHPDERAVALSLGPARRRDHAAGRLALRAALTAAGLAAEAPVLADERGAPVLAGALGSISHKRGLAVALAAPRTPDGARVGVDVELVTATRLDLSSRVLTDEERAVVSPLPVEARLRAVAIRFALKEAVYKAIDPFLRRYVGFREVAVWPDDDGTARVDAGALPVAVEAGWRQFGDLVVCCARAVSAAAARA